MVLRCRCRDPVLTRVQVIQAVSPIRLLQRLVDVLRATRNDNRSGVNRPRERCGKSATDQRNRQLSGIGALTWLNVDGLNLRRLIRIPREHLCGVRTSLEFAGVEAAVLIRGLCRLGGSTLLDDDRSALYWVTQIVDNRAGDLVEGTHPQRRGATLADARIK